MALFPWSFDIFLISPQKHKLWCSLEAPQGGASNEYPQHMFLWRNKKTIHSYLELWKKHNSGKNLFYKKVLVFFLFLQKNLYVVGSLWNQLTVTVSVTHNCPSWISWRGRMILEMISWSNLHESYVAELGFELAPLDLQWDALRTVLWSLVNKFKFSKWLKTECCLLKALDWAVCMKHMKGKRRHFLSSAFGSKQQ